uniref:TATA-box binding protein associated factor 4b n=1 Tax=Pelusios castaneus TaxID=367368 RepID=A0A8C8VJZ4_9SAUR
PADRSGKARAAAPPASAPSACAAGAPAGGQVVAVTKVPISLVPAVPQQSRLVAAPLGTLAKVTPVTATQQPPKSSGGPKLATPPTMAPKAPQTTTVQLPANFQIPPGTVLIRSNSGQLMLVSQQAIAQAQSQTQNNTGARPSVATSTSSVRICTVQNTGTHLLKKIVVTPVKTVSQTTNSSVSTDQRPAIVQSAQCLTKSFFNFHDQEMLENVKKCKNFLATLIKLASSGPQAPEMGQNVKNLVQHLLVRLFIQNSFKSMLALRQLMPNAQSFIQQCVQQQAPTQAAVSTSAAPTSSTVVTTSAHATTSFQPINTVLASAVVTGSQTVKPVLSTAAVTSASLQTVKPETAPLQPGNPVPTSALATTSLQIGKPVFASTVATTATAPLQPMKSVIGTPISIKITQPNSIAALSVHGVELGCSTSQMSISFHEVQLTLSDACTCKVDWSPRKLMPEEILTNKATPLETVGTGWKEQKPNIRFYFIFSDRDEDDINDVTSMAGVSLSEESACILATNSEVVGTLIRSCADEPFLSSEALQKKILDIGKRHDIMEPNSDVVNLISHATQERLRGLLEKLTVIAQHRMTSYKESNKYTISSDTRAQLKFLEMLDHMEKQRKDEEEREMLLRAAKSRSNKEDPEQLRLKQKAKEMQQLELAQMQQREANLTALAAIGPRKKRPLDSPSLGCGLEGLNDSGVASGSSGFNLTKQLFRPRITRVCLRDLIFCMEQEREMKHSLALYQALLK